MRQTERVEFSRGGVKREKMGWGKGGGALKAYLGWSLRILPGRQHCCSPKIRPPKSQENGMECVEPIWG